MLRYITAAVIALTVSVFAHAGDRGLSSVDSPYRMEETVSRLESALQARGVKIFATIDHAQEARSVGLSLRPIKLLIVGNPKAGTPLMQQDSTVGIDLPMKLLVWEKASGEVVVTWNSPDFLIRRHELAKEDERIFAALENLVTLALKP